MPNPHVFPLLDYPGPAPELAARSGQGNWEPYALAAPNDRLLPFVVTRLQVPGQASWLNCASIVDADTEELLFPLTPTGPTAGSPPALGLVFDKMPDSANGVDYFIYYGALIPGLTLPCGRALRLLVDNQWQSPRFFAVTDLSGYQRLEWSHPGPFSGVPYGTGFTQRLYVDNGGLQFAAPRTVETSTQDAVTGALRTDSFAAYAVRTGTVGVAPLYLADALSVAKAHKTFTIDGELWRLTEAKPDPVGPDGGRSTFTLTVEGLTPIQSRAACSAPPLAPAAFDPVADAPRPWRCGDASDTAPDFQPTGAFTCDVDENGNTGYADLTTQDLNPNSATYGATATRPGAFDPVRCPIPPTYYSAAVSGTAPRNDCPSGQTGTEVLYTVPAGQFSSRLSQADANDQATAFYNDNRQAYANAQGSCSGGGDTGYGPVYDGGGCFTCQMENRADAGDVRDATLAEIRAYFRNTDNDGAPCAPC
ncbi:DUF5977 domain-containing protein [Hymenobacter ruber]